MNAKACADCVDRESNGFAPSRPAAVRVGILTGRRARIELPTQIDSPRTLGCELGQGFLFAKPMSFNALSKYLAFEGQPAAAAGGRSYAA